MEPMLAELQGRLRKLGCVPTLMAWCIEGKAAHEFTPEQLRSYLDKNLSFVEREIAPVDHPRFRQLCISLEPLDEVSFTETLKVRGEFDFSDCWLDYAEQLQNSPAECLYCLTNHFAQPDPELWSHYERMTWSLTLLAGTFRFFSRQEVGVRLLEGHAGIEPTDYASASTLRDRFLARMDEEEAAIFGLALADLLALTDRHCDAVALLEALAWLEPEDYSDAVRLREKLQARLEEKGEPNNVAYFITTLAEALFFDRRHPDALRLLEAYARLGEAEEDPSEPRKILQGGLDRGLKPYTVNLFVRIYASALGFAGRHAASAELLETHLGIEATDYDREESLREKLGVDLSTRPCANHMAACLVVLSKAQRQQGRLRDAVRVLVAHLGVKETEATGERLGERLRSLRGKGLEGNNLANYAEALAEALRFLDRPEAAVQVMEGHLHLRSEDFGSASLLREKPITALGDQITANNAATYMKSLAKTLGSVGRQQDAISLLEAHGGLDGTDYGNAAGLRECFMERLGSTLTPNNAATYVVALADALGQVTSRQPDQLRLLEAHARMEGAKYTDSGWLFEKLRDLRALVHSDTAATYVRALADALSKTRPQDAARVLDCYLRQLVWQEVSDEVDILPANLCYLLNRWLGFFGATDRESVTACRRLIAQLRHSLSRRWLTPEDRWRFVERFSEIRQRVAQIGHHWAARERDPLRANQLRLDAYCWDAEMGQRLLLQRLLLGTPVLRGDDIALAPVNRLAASPERLIWNRSRRDSCLGCFEALTEPGRHVPTETAGQWTEIAPPSWYALLNEQLETGVEPRHLAESLLPNEVFLRATFTAEGQLVWNAFRRDGEDRLLFLADDAGQGGPGDREALRAAVNEHDQALDVIWDEWERCRNELGSSIQRIDILLQTGQFEFWANDWTTLVEVAEASGLKDLVQRLNVAFGTDIPTPDARFSETWATFWRERVRRRCDEATDKYLQNVARIWNLDALSEACRLTPEIDLVVQADDVLHAVPVAYLPVAGRRLLVQVASVRTVLSPLVSALQRQAQEEANRIDLGPEPRLVVVSYFERGDPAAYGAAWLHGRLRELAGCDCLEAFDDPPGSLHGLAAELHGSERRRVAALVTCGHGNADLAGVLLADGLWTGRYCDLSSADLIIQVSCSVGRNRQGGLRDVEGFCVELTVHRARSMLAGRWPLNSIESSRFAVAVIEEFVRGQEGIGSAPRARAVNRAARRFLETASGEVGLNTLAAFELYGLG